LFGSSLFGTGVFGGSLDPLTRVAIQGSGHTCSFKIFSEDNKPSYSINGLYVDYTPSGRR